MTNTKNHRHLAAVPNPTAPTRCPLHRGYEADYCPVCGTAQVIGR